MGSKSSTPSSPLKPLLNVALDYEQLKAMIKDPTSYNSILVDDTSAAGLRRTTFLDTSFNQMLYNPNILFTDPKSNLSTVWSLTEVTDPAVPPAPPGELGPFSIANAVIDMSTAQLTISNGSSGEHLGVIDSELVVKKAVNSSPDYGVNIEDLKFAIYTLSGGDRVYLCPTPATQLAPPRSNIISGVQADSPKYVFNIFRVDYTP